MSGAGARLSRLLALLPYLERHPGQPLPTVATDFGITVEQLVRDLELVFVCGLPGYGPADLIDVSWESGAVTLDFGAGVTRPLRLTRDEALALVVALRALADVPGLAERDALDRVLAKLETAVGAAAEPGGQVVVAVEGEGEVLSRIEAALHRGRRLDLTYHVAARDETTQRVVDPLRLLLVEGRTYLEAWCRRVEAVRLFRLDRVVAVTIVDLPSAPPPHAHPRDLADGLFVPSANDTAVTLLLTPSARWVADYYPGELLAEEPDGTVVFRLRTPDLAWVRRMLLALGGAGQALDPPALRVDVAAAARAALAAYDGADR